MNESLPLSKGEASKNILSFMGAPLELIVGPFVEDAT